ncbi:putative Type II secretion system protein E [Candidatus Glomeribacter gigasporarum BEG34]|uniref:Putative Type II secretion system protein E n=1 Tax=Candidatus Glomeribacter gigasporarum BEG34 TaxID=1070319 RepID=G2J836_9BURK|nr:ATPase, T2SS/T4P/T4SS family [Candidatus Glomeribacter gigasporarum]CCD28933.1 putative Type II secretion system protein E [Candidatus Glomeribacter gigasporarum BEG34]
MMAWLERLHAARAHPTAAARPVATGVSTPKPGGQRHAPAQPSRNDRTPAQQPSLPAWDTVHSIADLPTIRTIYTAEKAEFALSAALRAVLIAIGSDCGEAWLLVDAASFARHAIHLDSLRTRLHNARIPVVKTVFASRALIAEIYKTEHPDANEAGKIPEEGQLFEALIRYGLEHQATDIHCIVKGQRAVVKYRIDAEMERMRGPTDGVYTREQIRGALGYAYNTLVAEKTNSHAQFTPDQFQSCMIPYRLDDKVLNLRWQSSRGFCRQGSAFTVFIRYLYGEQTLPIEKFQDLGYSDDQAELFSRIGVNRKGLVLICGITNSGKSTTLSFYVETLPGRERLNIITVEDPAEREIEAAALQISLQRTLALDAERTPFSEIQGVLVRSDPDVIMQGEIRDVASGVCAQTLLQTGHQVLATTHAMGVMEAFARLSSSEIGFSMQTLTARKFWSLLVYQALVPKLCPACCEPADQTLPNITAFIRQRFHIDTSAMRTRCMGGCGACGGRGVRGVTVVAEMMQPTRSFLMLMREGRDFEAEAAWRSASDSRFDSPHMRGKTVFEHALYKAGCGLIDPRTVETFELFDQFEIIREVA